MVALLLRHDASPNVSDHEAKTPAHWAAIAGRVAIVEQLAAEDILTLVQIDDRGETVLHYAAFFGHVDVVAFVLSASVDFNAQDYDGISALHWAALKGHADIVQLLCAAGAYPNYMEVNGHNLTPFDYAATGGFQNCGQILVDFGGVDTLSMQTYAATIIQAAWRGYSQQKYLAYIQTEEGREQVRRDSAATIIAANYKGYRTRRQYKADLAEKRQQDAVRVCKLLAD